jgi:hypothetical protein
MKQPETQKITRNSIRCGIRTNIMYKGQTHVSSLSCEEMIRLYETRVSAPITETYRSPTIAQSIPLIGIFIGNGNAPKCQLDTYQSKIPREILQKMITIHHRPANAVPQRLLFWLPSELTTITKTWSFDHMKSVCNIFQNLVLAKNTPTLSSMTIPDDIFSYSEILFQEPTILPEDLYQKVDVALSTIQSKLLPIPVIHKSILVSQINLMKLQS